MESFVVQELDHFDGGQSTKCKFKKKVFGLLGTIVNDRYAKNAIRLLT